MIVVRREWRKIKLLSEIYKQSQQASLLTEGLGSATSTSPVSPASNRISRRTAASDSKIKGRQEKAVVGTAMIGAAFPDIKGRLCIICPRTMHNHTRIAEDILCKKKFCAEKNLCGSVRRVA